MSKTKTRKTDVAPEPPAVPAAPQVLDDQTALDELAERKAQKEQLPGGFTGRLEGGRTRKIVVDRNELGVEGGLPIAIQDVDTGETIRTDRIRIEGQSESRVTLGECGPVGVGIVTKAPILVGRCRR